MPRPYKQPTVNTQFGQWLRDTRAQRGWTMLDLAAHAATSASVISNIERGERRPSRQMALRLAGALETDPSPALLAAGFAPRSGVEELATVAIPAAQSASRVRTAAAYNNAPPEIRRAYDDLERAQLRLLDPFTEKSRRDSNAAKRADRLRQQAEAFDTLAQEKNDS